ncbi:SLC36A [Mytilus coruscus]|uniref:SLC36A n=1 Tax=Mytilus coruscus TaxID=42192 RepID=A0A6J8AW22_MYTCO|nr:SLC36A [Mytilus coruscus]
MRSMKLIHWLLILLPPICFMTLLRHLGSLALTSLMAQCSNLLAFAVVFWFDFEHFEHVEIHPKKMSIVGLPFFICIAIYCYEGAGMILSLESSLAKEVRKQFKTYFIFTMFIVTFLYISFGSAGYLSFGPETDEIITLNLPKVMMFPVMKILEGYLMSNPEKHIWRGNALRVIMVLVTGIVVMVIPNFATLMALVGATCCTMLAFVLPGLFHMTIFKGSLTIYQVIIDWTLMFIGILGAIIGTIDAFKRLSNAPSDEVMLPANLTATVGHIVSNIVGNITTVKSASP